VATSYGLDQIKKNDNKVQKKQNCGKRKGNIILFSQRQRHFFLICTTVARACLSFHLVMGGGLQKARIACILGQREHALLDRNGRAGNWEEERQPKCLVSTSPL
jgi:hypothetical protein